MCHKSLSTQHWIDLLFCSWGLLGKLACRMWPDCYIVHPWSFFPIFIQEHGLSFWEHYFFISCSDFAVLCLRFLTSLSNRPCERKWALLLLKIVCLPSHILLSHKCPVLQLESLSSHSGRVCKTPTLGLVKWSCWNSTASRMAGDCSCWTTFFHSRALLYEQYFTFSSKIFGVSTSRIVAPHQHILSRYWFPQGKLCYYISMTDLHDLIWYMMLKRRTTLDMNKKLHLHLLPRNRWQVTQRFLSRLT